MGDECTSSEELPLHSVHAFLESQKVCSPRQLPFKACDSMSCVSVFFVQSAFIVNITSIAPQHQCASLQSYIPLFWLTAAMPAAIKCAILNMTSVFVLHGCMVCLAADTVIETRQTQCVLTIPALHFIQGLACS